MKEANCKNCVYFVPYDELPKDLKKRARIEARLRGQKPLGWCKKGNHVVTYYEGYCRHFRPIEESLLKWIKR